MELKDKVVGIVTYDVDNVQNIYIIKINTTENIALTHTSGSVSRSDFDKIFKIGKKAILVSS
ncbi:hypothetical protein VCHSUH04_02205 [Veillonella sp. T14073-2]|uniref:hypothetical protein n=1 Tax=Veillonella sp. T14073-2 TaxID=1911680 RepID=UPI000CF47591|nr:hypothetical protein [Veillonella sp. T14073-2]PQL23326.1 hypothetical protein VCHSUH04_02205 [Veillonella sp. T14073-2]